MDFDSVNNFRNFKDHLVINARTILSLMRGNSKYFHKRTDEVSASMTHYENVDIKYCF